MERSGTTDPVRTRIDRLRRIHDSTAMRASLYADAAKASAGPVTDGSLTYLRRVPAPGKKIQKIGFIMLWVPEPTGATCAVGAPMILAGRYIEGKYNSSTVHDIGRATKDALSAIRGFGA